MTKLSLHVGSEVSLKDFSFSQLIIEVKKLFDSEGIPGFIKMLVVLTEALLIKSGCECPRCGKNKSHFHSKSGRKLKTSIGEVNLVLSRLKCMSCEKTFVPFNMLMDLNKYSRKSREFEKLSLETVTNQSFRRSAKNLNDTMGFSTAHTTLHRWFTNTDSTNMNAHRKVDFLVADGSGQRCLFHMTRELTPLLRYKDDVSKDEAFKISDGLNELLYLDLPEADADPIKSMEDKLKIEIKLGEMKKSIDSFIDQLRAMGYSKAKTFVENAKTQLFTYIDNWIKTGVSNPKVTSLVERIMREIKRRIKRMGYKWSEQGAKKMTRLILLQLKSTKHVWDKYWNEKMGSAGNIKLTFLGVTVDQI